MTAKYLKLSALPTSPDPSDICDAVPPDPGDPVIATLCLVRDRFIAETSRVILIAESGMYLAAANKLLIEISEDDYLLAHEQLINLDASHFDYSLLDGSKTLTLPDHEIVIFWNDVNGYWIDIGALNIQISKGDWVALRDLLL